MTDRETTIEELKDAVRKFRDERDWEKYHTPKDLAVSISIEAAELLELFQWKDKAEVGAMLEDEGFRDEIMGELADVVNYCLAMANTLDIDVSEALQKKVADNEERYPADRVKGKYRKYTEL